MMRYTPLDNVIDVQITRLRRKLDGGFCKKLLHTVRGVGFVLRKMRFERTRSQSAPSPHPLVLTCLRAGAPAVPCSATLLEYWQLRNRLYHAEIQDVETAEGLLAFAPDGSLVLNEQYHNHPEHILLLDRYMEVLTPDGHVLLRNAKLRWQELADQPTATKG